MDDRLRDAKRLADYVVIIAFDESQLRHGVSVGCIVQRFPQEDWPDVSLSPSLDVFSQPNGWILAAEPRTPSFFVNTLTDMIGARQFAYCLQVYEPCCGSADDVEGSSEVCEVSTNDNVLYKPKVIVILSRFSYFDLFRNCLNRIHLALLEDNGTAESMIATLISSVCLAPGLPAVPFTFASERLSVRAPSYPTVPVTADKIALFVHHLGSIYNLLLILCAVLTDHKLLMRSSSLSRLSDSCFALRCLLYPFDYP
ncbi:hypothetical protein AB6A40_000001 [Gnathostoma spinigerum]|uniref:UDENN domain-containing protein n=1 Tax=Gnathostoma spinigerum TaxID=75299 RepID=A0ABD6E9D0_9BILA